MGLQMVSADEQAKKQAEALLRGRHIVQGRWALTADGEVIPEENATMDGCTLLYRHGDEITVADALRAGFKVRPADEPESYTVVGRWVVGPDGRTVPEDEAVNGGQLVYRDGDVLSLEDARQAGFIRAEKKEAPKPADKQAPKPADKAVRKPSTKGAARRRRPKASPKPALGVK